MGHALAVQREDSYHPALWEPSQHRCPAITMGVSPALTHGAHRLPQGSLLVLSFWGEDTDWGVFYFWREEEPVQPLRHSRCYMPALLSALPLTLLRSSPPEGRSGVLCSEDGFVFSLLLLESLSLMMSYCLQKRAITAAERGGMKDSLGAAPFSPPHCHSGRAARPRGWGDGWT